MAPEAQLNVIDSHTGGEPTRIVISGGPALTGTMAQRLAELRDRHDWLRSAVVNEPRGSDVMVGALLCEPVDSACAAGIVFFNNVGYLGMCGHGTLGLAATLAHMGRISPGEHRIETPVGIVKVQLEDANTASIENVPSYRQSKNVPVQVPGLGTIRGDIAWGGNWFYLIGDHGQELSASNTAHLSEFTMKIRRALATANITGDDGAEIDHIELFGPPSTPKADSKNFVLCPGGAFDRSPCGTGTSAKLACLHADGKLAEGQIWRQESIIGSVFEGTVRIESGKLLPTIHGQAFVNGESTLILNPADPFARGIRA